MANTLKVFGIIVLVLGLIGSFILGNELGYREFNFYAFSSGLIGTALLGMSLLGFSELLSSLEVIRESTKNSERYIRQILDSVDTKDKNTVSRPSTPYNPTKAFINQKSSVIDEIREPKAKVCPKCGEMNAPNKVFCVICGAELK